MTTTFKVLDQPWFPNDPNNTPQVIMPITPMRLSNTASTVVMLGATPTYGGASPTCMVWGKLLARRMR